MGTSSFQPIFLFIVAPPQDAEAAEAAESAVPPAAVSEDVAAASGLSARVMTMVTVAALAASAAAAPVSVSVLAV
jgi:hypothetical protein